MCIVGEGYIPGLAEPLPTQLYFLFLVFELGAVVTVRWGPTEEGHHLPLVCTGLTGASFKYAFI